MADNVQASAGTGPEKQALIRGLRLPGVLMQSVGTMAPAASVVFTVQFLASYAGVNVPGAMLVAMVIMLALAFSLSQLSRVLPSAGGYYTFVRAAFGPKAGMAVGAAVLVYAFAPGMNSGYLSTILQTQINSGFGVNIPWQVIFVVMIAITGILAYRGISVSGKALLVLGLFEGAVLLALGLSGLIKPGPGGVRFGDLNPLGAHSGIYLAVVFAIFFFAGWEAAAPIAEESQDPERTIPRALIGSVLGLGILYAITTWGFISGWGPARIHSFATSPKLAAITLGQQYWSHGWVLILIALFNSVLAISLASTLIATRMIYAMSRVGVFPKVLSTLHPKHKTPAAATLVSVGFSLLVGLVGWLTVGPVNAYFIYGLAFTLLIIVVYIAGNFAVTKYYHSHLRPQFRLISHVLIPVITTLMLIYVGYRSIWPLPAYPEAWGVWLAIIWVVLLLVLMITLSRTAGDELESVFLGEQLDSRAVGGAE
jgi:amino acid transporter